MSMQQSPPAGPMAAPGAVPQGPPPGMPPQGAGAGPPGAGGAPQMIPVPAQLLHMLVAALTHYAPPQDQVVQQLLGKFRQFAPQGGAAPGGPMPPGAAGPQGAPPMGAPPRPPLANVPPPPRPY